MKSRAPKRLAIAIGWAALLAAAGCTPKTAPGTSIRIGEVGSLTGSEATFGTSTHNAIALALKQANAKGGVKGRLLELLTVDDQGKSSEAALGITKLIAQDKVVAVLGEVASSKSLAMAPIAQQRHVPMITPSSINSRVTETGDEIFRVCFTDKFQSRVMAEFALKNLKARKAAILEDSTNDYSVDSAKLFTELFEKGGGKVVLLQNYASGDIDFKSQLTSIRAQAPDVILVPGYYTDVALMARQRKELGFTAPFLGGDGWDSPKLLELSGTALEGSYFVTHFFREDPLPAVQGFVKDYHAAYGQDPDGLAALGYDAAQVLIRALSQGGDLRAALAATHDFPGVTGRITLDAERNAVKDALVLRVDPAVAAGGAPRLSIAARIKP